METYLLPLLLVLGLLITILDILAHLASQELQQVVNVLLALQRFSTRHDVRQPLLVRALLLIKSQLLIGLTDALGLDLFGFLKVVLGKVEVVTEFVGETSSEQGLVAQVLLLLVAVVEDFAVLEDARAVINRLLGVLELEADQGTVGV